MVILKEDVDSLANYLAKKKHEQEDIDRQIHLENLRTIRKQCSEVRRSMLQLKHFDNLYADDEVVNDLQEAWKTQHQKLIDNKKELDLSVNDMIKTLKGQLGVSR